MILKKGTFRRFVVAQDSKGDGPGPTRPKPPKKEEGRVDTRKNAPDKVTPPEFTGGDGISKRSASRVSDVMGKDKRIGGSIDAKTQKSSGTGNVKKGLEKGVQDKWKRIWGNITQQKKSMNDMPEIAKSILKEWENNKPVINWREILKKYLNKAKNMVTMKFPNRRGLARRGSDGRRNYVYGFERRGKNAIDDVVVAIDTSGSVSQEQVQIFVNEVMGIPELVIVNRMTIIYMSDAIDGVDTFSPANGEKPDMSKYGSTGGNAGGFIPPFAHVKEKLKITPSVFLYMTDGHATYPSSNMYDISKYQDKVIWFIVRNEKGFGVGPDGKKETLDFDKINDLPPFGEMMLYSVKDFMKGSKGYHDYDD